EDQALQNPTKETLNRILQVKREVMHLRQIVSPQREVMTRFARGDFKLIRPHVVPYYRDVYDGISRISDLAQGYADSLTGILQVYRNMSSNQTGEGVKLVALNTVNTTSLKNVGTWLGKNFKDMPEPHWEHGYWIAAVLMISTTAITFWYFRKRKWF